MKQQQLTVVEVVKAKITQIHACLPKNSTHVQYCQALSISQSLNLSLSLRDRADTKITFHPPTKNFLSAL